MGSTEWYRIPAYWLNALMVFVGWRLFCWGSGYSVDGCVCDFAPSKVLPCDRPDQPWLGGG